MLAQYIIYKLEMTNKYWRSYLYLKSTAANTEKNRSAATSTTFCINLDNYANKDNKLKYHYT